MKKTIAAKLTVRVTAILAAAFVLLLAGTYLSLNNEVKKKSDQYTTALVGIFGDLIKYESDNLQHPIDLSFSDRISFFGDYLCTWYKIDYVYAIVPDFENGKITYLSSVSKKGKEVYPSEGLTGKTVDYIISDDMVRSWNDSTYFAIQKSDRFKNGTDVMWCISDSYGNKVLVGADVSTDEFHKDVLHGFMVFTIFMFIIIDLLAVVLYILIRSMVSAPARRISRRMSEYVAGGDVTPVPMESFDSDEYSMIADSFNHMTEDIGRYVRDITLLSRDRERQQTEFDIGADIQKGMLPRGTASMGNCSIKAVMKPAKCVAGDLYDYLELDDTHTMVVIADVSGKGIPSAILMAVMLTHFHQFAMMGYSPAGILKNVNDSFSRRNPNMMFVTAFVGIYDSCNGILTYANAGHNPPYHIHDGLTVLDGSDGSPLGLFDGEEYTDVKIRIEEGDSLFLYTDGVNEAVNDAGEFYGTDRLENILRQTASSADNRFVEAVEASLSEFAGNAEQNDDITMLSVSFKERNVLELGYDVREFGRIRKLLFDSGLPEQMLMDLCLAAEECFVNICSYAFDGPAPEGEKILFYFDYSDKVSMRFSDGGKRFDPRCNLPDIDGYDVDTTVGGLGRLIAFSVADSVDYQYKDGRNILTITKSIINQI